MTRYGSVLRMGARHSRAGASPTAHHPRVPQNAFYPTCPLQVGRRTCTYTHRHALTEPLRRGRVRSVRGVVAHGCRTERLPTHASGSKRRVAATAARCEGGTDDAELCQHTTPNRSPQQPPILAIAAIAAGAAAAAIAAIAASLLLLLLLLLACYGVLLLWRAAPAPVLLLLSCCYCCCCC